MKKVVFTIGFLVCLSICLLGQSPPPSPPPPQSPPPQSPPSQSPPPVPQGTPFNVRSSRLSELMQPRSLLIPDSNSEMDPLTLRQMIVQRYAQPLYRKATDKEMSKINPDPKLYAEYKEFLERPNTGVFRLVVDNKCDADTKVVNASEVCLEYTMPGSGNSYSFRMQNYRLRRLADITYTEGRFETSGVMMNGAITDLGDVSIQSMTLNSDGVLSLTEFQPAKDASGALALDEELRAGVNKNGRLYGSAARVLLHHTYALRTIAYRGKIMRAVKGAAYNELDFDRRRDVVIGFRVAAIEPDGSLTIVWTELRDVESPKLKIDRDDLNKNPVSKARKNIN